MSYPSPEQYRERAIAMRREAEWAERYDLKITYRSMADEWDALAAKLEQIEERLKH